MRVFGGTRWGAPKTAGAYIAPRVEDWAQLGSRNFRSTIHDALPQVLTEQTATISRAKAIEVVVMKFNDGNRT